jgi:hypothetical protein
MRLLLAALFIVALIVAPGTPARLMTMMASAGTVSQFPSEAEAQSHCPHDTVFGSIPAASCTTRKACVGMGIPTHGAYVCEAEADTAGNRDTRNGQ